MSNPNQAPEPPRAELPSERAALAVRPSARGIRLALKRAGLDGSLIRITTGRRRCRVDFTAYLDEYGEGQAEVAAQVVRRLWNDHRTRITELHAPGLYRTFLITVADYWHTAPLDLVDLCHAAAKREDEERTPAPVTSSAEFPAGLRLRNPQTGATFEVVEHTHAVRVRNLRTDVVSAIPQELAREFERRPAEVDSYLDRVRGIRVRIGKREAERLQEQARLGLQRLVAAASNMPRALMMFANSVERASVVLAEAFPMSQPNACDLCGLGVGERDHPGGHPYEPPSDATRLGRMVVRRLVDAPARERIHAAHVQWRRAVRLRELKLRLDTEAPYWTERSDLERAGLTETPFDQQRVQPDASAFSLPS